MWILITLRGIGVGCSYRSARAWCSWFLQSVSLWVVGSLDEFVGTLLVTSDHSFVSCVLLVGQSVPEYNVRSTVFLKHRINWDKSAACAVTSFTWSTILKSADPLDAFYRAISEVIIRYVPNFLPLFCAVDLETCNGLIPVAGELMKLNRLLIVSGVEGAVLITAVNLRLHLLKPRGSMVLQGSSIINAPGILSITPPVHISGVRHWKARSLVQNHLFLLKGGAAVVWWCLLQRNLHSYAPIVWQHAVSWLVSSLSLLYLLSLCLGAINVWPSGLFSSSVCVLILNIWGCWSFGCVSFILRI